MYMYMQPLSAVVLGAFGGRFDQQMSGVHVLYKWKSVFNRVVLMDKENIVFLLTKSFISSTDSHSDTCPNNNNGEPLT